MYENGKLTCVPGLFWLALISSRHLASIRTDLALASCPGTEGGFIPAKRLYIPVLFGPLVLHSTPREDVAFFVKKGRCRESAGISDRGRTYVGSVLLNRTENFGWSLLTVSWVVGGSLETNVAQEEEEPIKSWSLDGVTKGVSIPITRELINNLHE